jgi:GDP-D-mannose dehydratase
MENLKKVVIFGCQGQDGYLLSQKLFNLGFNILGFSSSGIFLDNQKFDSRNTTDISINEICDLILDFTPSVIFYLSTIHR